MAMTNEHKTAISNIRKAIKAAGFKASVSGYSSCGDNVVRVCVPSFNTLFTSDQIAVFAQTAKTLGLTHVMNTEFSVEEESELTGSRQFNYFL